jgi:hypothetical protein
MKKIYKLESHKYGLNELYKITDGTFKVGSLQDVTYDEIAAVFGEPSISEPSGDEKIQFEWVLTYDDKVFTIYDYKTFNREYTLYELTVWSVGGQVKDTDFFELLTDLIPKAIIL